MCNYGYRNRNAIIVGTICAFFVSFFMISNQYYDEHSWIHHVVAYYWPESANLPKVDEIDYTNHGDRTWLLLFPMSVLALMITIAVAYY